MKRIFLTAMLAAIVGSTSGCCLFDRLFCCRPGYPMPNGCGGGCNSGCCNQYGNYGSYGNGCDSGCCTTGGCCPSGGCSTGCCTTGCGGGNPNLAAGGPEGGFGPGCGAAKPSWPYYGPPPMQAAQYEGPAQGQVVYPYYTTRGPRDFLSPNPGSIGP